MSDPKPLSLQTLDFEYPPDLVATEPQRPSRACFVDSCGEFREVGLAGVLVQTRPGDLWVLNNTRVLRRRVFTVSGLEILFLKPLNRERTEWEVLCPSRRWNSSGTEVLPQGIALSLRSKGRPQVLHATQPLDESFFEAHGELPLPPYIQRARSERHTRAKDTDDYQTTWAKVSGSLAAPTASLHFTQDFLEKLRERGVIVKELTLHVGIGTFLPIESAHLSQHKMHAEEVSIPAETWQEVLATKKRGGRVWAVGTTVTRALESAASGFLPAAVDGSGLAFEGMTEVFIQPGYQWRVVDVLATNFHQPHSTLLALVMSFAGVERVREVYRWAVENRYRLFSYGDLSVWERGSE